MNNFNNVSLSKLAYCVVGKRFVENEQKRFGILHLVRDNPGQTSDKALGYEVCTVFCTAEFYAQVNLDDAVILVTDYTGKRSQPYVISNGGFAGLTANMLDFFNAL